MPIQGPAQQMDPSSDFPSHFLIVTKALTGQARTRHQIGQDMQSLAIAATAACHSECDLGDS